ncbi:MAG: hypothetical protein KDA60_10275, partial [Planctomycetales bacterium]|nr:hypothetical protein [Planctomycetales bacterium]
MPEIVGLIGYRGTGKTLVGQALARQLGWAFEDTDRVIQETAGCTIADLFAEVGETGFRDQESAAIAALAESFRGVLSLGGGAVLRHIN